MPSAPTALLVPCSATPGHHPEKQGWDVSTASRWEASDLGAEGTLRALLLHPAFQPRWGRASPPLPASLHIIILGHFDFGLSQKGEISVLGVKWQR